MRNSKISGLYRQSIPDRIKTLVDNGILKERDGAKLLVGTTVLSVAQADRMTENVVGVFGLPLGVAPNFLVNNRDHVVPMVVEEPSIIAGVSGAAKLIRTGGGFTVATDDSFLVGQIQMHDVDDPAAFIGKLDRAKAELQELANAIQPNLVKRGGGTKGIEVFQHSLSNGEIIVVLHLLVDTCDAMGANVVNTICERLAPEIQRIAGGSIGLRILSNLADRAMVSARARVPLLELAEDAQAAAEIRDGIVRANQFALADPYRAATHNKGIMNGIDALAIATGNDWRAIEAGAHAYAARDGQYKSLTDWSVDDNGDLVGTLTLPLKPGTVGGSLQSNPGAHVGLALSGVETASELAELMAATGLAQNLAALRALTTSGIQKGHMALHARSVATSADIPNEYFDDIVTALIKSGEVKIWKAKELLTEFKARRPSNQTMAAAETARGCAAGKVILLGEHAVVYGRHALALPIEEAVVATVCDNSSQMWLAAPDWGISENWRAGDADRSGAAAVVNLIVAELDATERNFSIEIASRVPLGMGLGSSASFAVAVIRAMANFMRLELDNDEVNRIALKCEEITHGTPSGVDNYLATFARPILFKAGGERSPEQINLTDIPPLVIAASGVYGNTKNLIDGVRQRYEVNEAQYAALFNNIDELTLMGATALAEGNYEKLGSAMNICHGLLNAIGVSTPELENMVAMVRDAGALGAKLTGAGGGGSIVALCPGKVDEVSRTLDGAGYQIVSISE